MRQARTLFRPRCRPFLVIAAILAARTAEAAPIVVDGQVPADGPDHFFVDFDVPAGTKEIAITHTGAPKEDILDFGLLDPNGYRGWGGGTSEQVIVGELAASRAYVAGPIGAGTWRVVIGKAKIAVQPATYHIEIDLRTAPTLPPFTDRQPYAPAPPRKTETRYYAGDFHCHSRESTDASPTIPDMIALAKSRGLDFMEVSDHNTVTQMDELTGIQAGEPSFLLIPGIEFTTYKGHANAIGATKWVDHKIGQPGVTIDGAMDAIRAQGAIFSVNHPMLDLGDLCIGCAWKHDIDFTKLGGVEIATGGLSQGGFLFTPKAIQYWDGILDKGIKIPAIGGSDDHQAGQQKGSGAESPIGDPTTLVRATELSVQGILDGIRKGATVVKLQGPGDPMVELEAAPQKGAAAIGYPGDTLGVRAVALRVKVTGASGQTIRLVKNGVPEDAVQVPSDPFVYERIVPAPAQGEDRWRAEALIDDQPHTVTSHVWLKNDPTGPEATEPSGDSGGCRTSPREEVPGVLVGILLAIGVVRARKR